MRQANARTQGSITDSRDVENEARPFIKDTSSDCGMGLAGRELASHCCNPSRDQFTPSQGLSSSTPVDEKSSTLRVTSVIP